MDLIFLILSVLALVVLVAVVYPRIRERRERELAKRLERTKDPAIAMLEVEVVMRQHRHEAGFFRAIMKYVWPLLFR